MRAWGVTVAAAVSTLLVAACDSSDHGAGPQDGAARLGDSGPTIETTPGDGEASLEDAASGPESDAAAAGGDASAPDASWDGATPTCLPPRNSAGTCYQVEPLGPLVTSSCSSAEPPQVEGGTILNGTYILDSLVFLGGCPATPLIESTTWVICGENWVAGDSIAVSPDAAAESSSPLAYIVTIQGTSVSFGPSCGVVIPESDMEPRGFTATDTGLTFVYANSSLSGSTIMSHYTLQ
jgi:hypothetical protein